MNETLLVNLEVKDTGTVEVEKFKYSLKSLSSQFDNVNKGADQFGSAMVSQAAKLPGISDAVSLLGKTLDHLKTPFISIPVLTGAAVTSLIAFGEANVKTVTELKRLSDTTGLSVNSLAALKKVGAATETSLDSIVGAVTKLEKNLGESGKAFKKLGVEGKDPLDVLASLADRFKATNDPVDRARLGFLAFGKSWKDMAPMLAEGGEAIRKAGEASTISQSMVMRYESIHRNQLLINNAASGWKTVLGDLASGPLALVTDMLAGMAKTSAETAKNIRSMVNKESDRSFADNWMSGSDSAASEHLKGISQADLSKPKGIGEAIKANEKFSTATIRAKWALEQFKKENIETQEAILNGVKNKGNTPGRLGDLDEKTISQMEKVYGELKAKRDKILSQGDGTTKSIGDESIYKEEELRVKEFQKAQDQIRKIKEKYILDSFQDEREKESIALSNKFQEEQLAANGNSELLKAIQEKYRQDVSNLNRKWDLKEFEDNLKYKQDEIKSKRAIEDAHRKLEKEQEETVLRSRLAYEEEVYQAHLEKEREQWERFSNYTTQVLVSPLENFTKHIGSMNQTLRGSVNDLVDGIGDSFGNMFARLTAEYAASSVFKLFAGGAPGTISGSSFIDNGGIFGAIGGLLSSSPMFFANGTNYSPGGRAVVAERQTEAILPPGSQVVPLSKLGGNTTQNITVNNYSNMTEKQLTRSIGRAIREQERKRNY